MGEPLRGEHDTMELATWDDIPDEVQLSLLDQLGYSVEDDRILDENGEPATDPYTGDELRFSNLAILPGNSPPVLLDNNPVSLACYMEDYGADL